MTLNTSWIKNQIMQYAHTIPANRHEIVPMLASNWAVTAMNVLAPVATTAAIIRETPGRLSQKKPRVRAVKTVMQSVIDNFK